MPAFEGCLKNHGRLVDNAKSVKPERAFVAISNKGVV